MRERLSSRSARFPLIFATLDSDSSKEPNDARREKELLVSGYKAVSRLCIWLWTFQLQGINSLIWQFMFIFCKAQIVTGYLAQMISTYMNENLLNQGFSV